MSGTSLVRYFDLVALLAERTLKARYRGSHLGVLWSLSNPLLMTLVYTAIFGASYARYYGSTLGYMLAVFVGLSVLGFFSNATGQALGGIVSGGPLLNKIALPCSIFPLGYVAANAFQFVITTFPLLVAVTIWRTHSLAHVVALVFPLIALLAISIGFALVCASLNVFFRDLAYLYEVFVFILYITSPIFYPEEVVPHAVRAYVALNPLATIVIDVRLTALGLGPVPVGALAGSLTLGAVVMAVGIVVYAFLRDEFIDLL